MEYVWGNYVGGWLWPAVRLRMPVRVVAVGTTAKALTGLVKTSDLEVVTGDPMIHPSVASALDSLP